MPHQRPEGQDVALAREPMAASAGTVPSSAYYGEYHGHKIQHLTTVFDELVSKPRKAGQDVRVVWLVGDSSLDNKFWLTGHDAKIPANNGMQRVLEPPTSVADVAAHMNTIMDGLREKNNSASAPSYLCINCSVEESTIGMRKKGEVLLPQDQFVKDRLQHGDAVIISLGGNDIALKPTPSTICGMGWLTRCSSPKNIVKGNAWGLGTLRSLMVNELSAFLRVLLSNLGTTSSSGKRSAVMPCVVYYLDENAKAESWASATLSAVGYDKNPKVVQSIIDNMVTSGTQAITCDSLGLHRDVHVEVVPLSKALDGKRSEDYVARVEPSVIGGRRMAELLWGTITRALHLSA